jgi:hypothetical protein
MTKPQWEGHEDLLGRERERASDLFVLGRLREGLCGVG